MLSTCFSQCLFVLSISYVWNTQQIMQQISINQWRGSISTPANHEACFHMNIGAVCVASCFHSRPADMFIRAKVVSSGEILSRNNNKFNVTSVVQTRGFTQNKTKHYKRLHRARESRGYKSRCGTRTDHICFRQPPPDSVYDVTMSKSAS